MGKRDEQWERYYEALNNKYNRGEISYSKLVSEGDKGLANQEAECNHKKSTRENFDSGAWIEWCDSCGVRVRTHGSGAILRKQPQKKKKGFWDCSVVAIVGMGYTTMIVALIADNVPFLS